MGNLEAAADAVYYQGSSIFGGKPGFGVIINGAPGRILAFTEASRMGIALAADQAVYHDQALHGGKPGWKHSVNRNPAPAGDAHRRAGIAMDAAILETGSRFGARDGWNRGKNNNDGDKLPARVESRRAGLERTAKENGMIYEYGDHFPHLPGLVLPYDGGADILLRLPPAKCETMADLSGALANLSRAAMRNPRVLLDAVTAGMGLTDAAQSALTADVDADLIKEAWEELAYSELGEAMFRLKFAQIENKTPVETVRDYQHETSLVLARPPSETPIPEYKEMLAELRQAEGERGLILTCGEEEPMAYLARERLGEGWTSVRMSDGNLLWKTWR